MKSWMTTTIGVVALVVGAYLLYTGKITWEQFMAFLAIFGLGAAAKDNNVSGGSR